MMTDGEAGRRITWIGVGVNLVLVAGKLAAGLAGHSQALVADAVHSVSDLFTDVVVLVGLKMGRKAPDADHHFGHGRIETLASAVVGLSLLVVAGLLAYQASLDVYRGEASHPTWLTVAAAAASIGLKELIYRYTIRVGRRIGSPAVIANAWHHRSDALSSVAVLIGVAGAQIHPDWHILDAVATVVVALLVGHVAFQILWRAVREMVDTAPDPEVTARILGRARAVEGVCGVHDLKIRSIGGRLHVQVHVEVDGNLSVSEGHRIAQEVEDCLLILADVVTVLVHVDPVGGQDPGS